LHLEVLVQLANVEITRLDVVTQYLTIVCEFILSGLPLHLRPKKKHLKLHLKASSCNFLEVTERCCWFAISSTWSFKERKIYVYKWNISFIV